MQTDLRTALDAAAEFERLQSAATPGPWWRTDSPWGSSMSVHAGPSDDPHASLCLIADGDIIADELIADEVCENMAFIAHARSTTLPALIRELVAEVERLRNLAGMHEYKDLTR